MKNLIVVRGVANTGKSESIKIAYQMFKTAYPRAKIQELFVGVDITIIITINGVKVGIESQGDPSSKLFRSLKHFVRTDCQLIICATRTRGGTVDAVNALSRKYEVNWIDKTRIPNPKRWKLNNRSVAREIFEATQHLHL